MIKPSFDPCDFVLFGTIGDLARRKLLPSLYQLEKADLIHSDTKFIGVARQAIEQSEYVAIVRENLEKFLGEAICEDTWGVFQKTELYVYKYTRAYRL